MTPRNLHDWTMTAGEARALQGELAGEVVTTGKIGDWNTLAAADVSFNRGSDVLYAAVVVVERETLKVIERVGVAGPSAFPYVPGLLSFREAPSFDVPAQFSTDTGLSNNLPLHVHVLTLGEGPGATKLKLIQTRTSPGARVDQSFIQVSGGDFPSHSASASVGKRRAMKSAKLRGAGGVGKKERATRSTASRQKPGSSGMPTSAKSFVPRSSRTTPVSTAAVAMYRIVQMISEPRMPMGMSLRGFFASWPAVETASKPM